MKATGVMLGSAREATSKMVEPSVRVRARARARVRVRVRVRVGVRVRVMVMVMVRVRVSSLAMSPQSWWMAPRLVCVCVDSTEVGWS